MFHAEWKKSAFPVFKIIDVLDCYLSLTSIHWFVYLVFPFSFVWQDGSPSGTQFSSGSYNIVFKAIDQSDNEGFCSFVLTVNRTWFMLIVLTFLKELNLPNITELPIIGVDTGCADRGIHYIILKIHEIWTRLAITRQQYKQKQNCLLLFSTFCSNDN